MNLKFPRGVKRQKCFDPIHIYIYKYTKSKVNNIYSVSLWIKIRKKKKTRDEKKSLKGRDRWIYICCIVRPTMNFRFPPPPSIQASSSSSPSAAQWFLPVLLVWKPHTMSAPFNLITNTYKWWKAKCVHVYVYECSALYGLGSAARN